MLSVGSAFWFKYFNLKGDTNVKIRIRCLVPIFYLKGDINVKGRIHFLVQIC